MLWHNQISDIFPLVQNQGINSGDTINLGGNPLSDLSIDTYIPELKNRGANVSFTVDEPPVGDPPD